MKFNASGSLLFQFGTRGSGNGQLYGPTGIALDSSGNIYIADTNNNRIEKFNSSGTYVSQFGSYGTANGKFWYPRGIAIDTSWNIFVSDQNNRVQVFNSSGTYVSQFGSAGSGDGQFSNPVAIVFSKAFYYQNGNGDDIYVVDRNNNRVQIFSSYGTYKSQIGGFSSPLGISIDVSPLSGSLYVSDGYNNLVKKFLRSSYGSASSGQLLSSVTFTANCTPSYTNSSVVVTVLPPLPVITLSATPNPVVYNGSTNISWTASGDISGGCTLTGNGTTFWPSNITSATVNTGPLITTTTFSLSCTGLGGTVTQDLVVSVNPPDAPSMTISSLSPIAYSSSTIVSWSASSSDSCLLYKNNISQGNVNPVSGSTPTGNMTTDTTFLLSCTGIGGTSTTSPLTINILPPLAASISANSTLVPYNSSTYINWGSTGAISCSITKNGSSFYSYSFSSDYPQVITATTPVSTSGGAGISSGISLGSTPSYSLYTGPITVPTIFDEVCVNGLISTTTSVTVKPIIPITITLNANPTYVSPGGTTTISWSSTGADSCTLTRDGGSFATGTSSPGISSGSISSATTFVATCINSSATTTQSLVVETNPVIDGAVMPITINLSANPISVPSGGTTTISWSSIGADSCTITRSDNPSWSATGVGSSITNISITATTTFTVTCTNSYSPTKYTYNYNSSFVVPTGVSLITTELWGGGGRGGDNVCWGCSSGAGGGGGGYGKQTIGVVPGATYPITIGGAGQNSTFGSLFATGGGNGGQVGGFYNGSTPTIGGTGGYSNAVLSISGQNGGNGGVNLKGGDGGSAANGGAGGAGAPAAGINGTGGGNGGSGIIPGGGGGGGASGWNGLVGYGGAGARGAVAISLSGGIATNSETKSITVAVQTPTVTATPTNVAATPTINCSNNINLSWVSGPEADYFDIYRDGLFIANVLYSPLVDSLQLNDNSTHTYYVVAHSSLGYSASSSVVSAAANQCPPAQQPVSDLTPSSTCTYSQPANDPGDNNVYVNRNTIWALNLDISTTTVPTNVHTDWTGTNISGTISTPGMTLEKIYSTVGLKEITASVTGNFGDIPFSSSCSTSTIVKVYSGTGQI